MGRAPCCDEVGLKKGPWTPEEDKKLTDLIRENGHGSWRALPKLAGLNRCGKSCRLRWTNYLRPDIKRGRFSEDEQQQIIQLHSVLGNKWSAIATRLPGRTDNEVKNYWNTHLRKKLMHMGIDPVTHRPRADLALLANLPALLAAANLGNLGRAYDNISALRLQADAEKLKLVQNIFQALSGPAGSTINDPVSLMSSDSGAGNYQLGDLSNMNHHGHGQGDGSHDLGLMMQSLSQISSSFPNLGVPADHFLSDVNLYEACTTSYGGAQFDGFLPGDFSSDRESERFITSSNLTSNSTPSLASDSSEKQQYSVTEIPQTMPDDLQAPASVSEPWEELSLMEELSREFFCDQSTVLEDTFSSTWPATSQEAVLGCQEINGATCE